LPISQQRALVIAGGGPLGRAWEIGLLKGLKDAGIDLTQADMVVGTSIGGILGAQIRAGKALDSLYSASLAPAGSPAPASGPPPYDPAYAQQAIQPVASLTSAAELSPAVRIEVGKRALAAPRAISEDAQVKATASSLGDIHDWPAQLLKLPAVDAADGSIRLFDKTQGVPLEQAVAATTANPASGKTPITIDGRRYMEGTLGGSHVEVAAGYAAIVALTPATLLKPEIARQQVEAMRSKGEKIVALEPDAESLAAMGPDRFDLSRAKPAAEAGFNQAASLAPQVRSLWLGGTVTSSVTDRLAAGPASSAAVKPRASAPASALAKPGALTSAPAGGPASVPRRWIDSINRGDQTGLGALVTDDAVLAGAGPCTLKNPCVGPAGAAKRVQTAIDRHAQQALLGTPAVAGNIVQWRQEVRNDPTKAAGLDRYVVLNTLTLRGDKISSAIELVDLSDAQSAKLQAYLQQQAVASASAKPAASGAAASADALAVARRFQDATAMGDANAAAAAFTEDAVFIGGNGCPPTAPCSTPAAILKRAQNGVSTHNRDTMVGTPVVVGNLVQMRLEVRGDLISAAGVDRVLVDVQEQVNGDKISSLVNEQDLNDGQVAKSQLYSQAQSSGATKPAASAAAGAKPAT